MVKRKRIAAEMLLILGALIVLTAFILIVNKVKGSDSLRIENITTDKSRYNPGDTVNLEIVISNEGENKESGKITLSASHLGIYTGEEEGIPVTVNSMESKKIKATWTAPEKDFTGYLLEVTLEGKWGNNLGNATTGVDVSSSAIKFPRYGYLSNFAKDVNTKSFIETMTDYHINMIEYYDWHHLHHKPLADGISKENPGVWKDWAGREIYGETLANYIKDAKAANMLNMAYNMIYAGTDTFFADEEGNPTKANDWKLVFAPDNDRGSGEFKFHMGTSPSGNGNLYFLNPLNIDWQKYIFAEENKIFDVFDFDGWHGDTVGDWGKMTTSSNEPLGYDENGEPIYQVTDTYTQFLNAAKEALGDKYLSFNPVGAQGIENANKSKTDILYTEFWPWDRDREGQTYDTYYSLVKEVERSFGDSKVESFDGKGKSLVVKAYINYDKTVGNMNDPAVILAASSVYAAGGSRLEIGNGSSMLHTEYYPDDKIPMSEELQQYMKGFADFIVAYENLLRDGQSTGDREVVIDGYAVSKTGESDTIWAYTKEDEEYEILHLINLLDTDNLWRDERGKKSSPKEVSNIQVKYYTDKDINQAYVASPDLNKGKSEALKIRKGSDELGKFITFTIEKLAYWDLIYFR